MYLVTYVEHWSPSAYACCGVRLGFLLLRLMHIIEGAYVHVLACRHNCGFENFNNQGNHHIKDVRRDPYRSQWRLED